MRKILPLAAAAAALLAVTALPLHSSPVEAKTITCKEAAQLKYPHNLFKRIHERRACKAAWKAHQKA